MLTSLFIGQLVDTIAQALASSAPGADSGAGIVAVLGQPRVASALRQRGYRVLTLAAKRKSLRRAKGERLYAHSDALPLAADSLVALVAFDVGQREDWSRVMAEWVRAVAPGGAIVLVDRASPSELTQRALCSGLMEIEQRQTGRTFITSGVLFPA